EAVLLALRLARGRHVAGRLARRLGAATAVVPGRVALGAALRERGRGRSSRGDDDRERGQADGQPERHSPGAGKKSESASPYLRKGLNVRKSPVCCRATDHVGPLVQPPGTARPSVLEAWSDESRARHRRPAFGP